MDVLEIIGVAVGILYLYWEFRADRLLWIAGVVMPAIYIFVYFYAGFYADAAINLYYLGAGIYGWVFWHKGRTKEGRGAQIIFCPARWIAPMLLIFTALWAALWVVLEYLTDSSVALGDAFTTALSVIGLWLLSRRVVEQWLVWLVVDAVCAWLYITKGLTFTGYLYAFYALFSIVGYFRWRAITLKKINPC